MELKVPPPVVMLSAAALMYGLSRLNAGYAWQAPLWLPLLFACGGLIVAAAGALVFRRHRTTLSPFHPHQTRTVVDSGIFRHSRNPMYLGMALLLAAWALWLGRWPALFGIPLFVLYINRFQIGPEERMLGEKFGEAYRRYCRQTRRWL